MSFVLDPRLEELTIFAADWPLARVLVMNDARYVWLTLVPRRVGIVEITDLSIEDRALLIEEAARAGEIVKRAGAVKLNFGALGNMVPQLHLHVVGRAPGDPAWPGPVWGHGAAVPYDEGTQAQRLMLVRSG